MNRRFRTASIALASAAAIVLATAGTASAHVSVDTLGEVATGEMAKIALSIPNERDDATTTKIEVQLPKDSPLPFVRTLPKPGWDVTVTRRDLDTPVEVWGASYTSVVDTITWTATGDTAIGVDQFDQFWMQIGPIPEGVDELAFPTLQTYDSGEVVSWIEPMPASGEEPEHPVPALSLTGESSHGHSMGGEMAAHDDSGSDSHVLGIIALVVAGLALIVGGAAWVSARKPKAASGPGAADPT
jgi:periplasmic copper chaperone A